MKTGGVILLVVLGLIGAGLIGKAIGVQRTKVDFGIAGPATPAPPDSITDPLDPAQRSAVIAYGMSLSFADSIHHPQDNSFPRDRYHGQWDKNMLDTLGTIGVLDPEENIHHTQEQDLSRGRIQLRITIVPSAGRPPSEVYFGKDTLAPGVSYVWVDHLQMVTKDSGTARAVYVPMDTAYRVRTRTIDVLRGKVWNRAVARWTPGQCWDCATSDWCH